jgi:hypothetical protein
MGSVYVWQISCDVQPQIQSVTWHFQKQNWMSIDIYILFQNVTSIFGLHYILENWFFEWFVTQKKLPIERKYPLVSHVSPNVEDSRPIHCIHFKPTKRNPHKSIKSFQVQPIAQVAFDCILICILQHSPTYVWNYPCSYICNCLTMTKKSQINEYSDLSIYKLATLKRKN